MGIKKVVFTSLVLILALVFRAQSSTKQIIVYAGAASKPPTEEVIKRFKHATGTGVDVIFGGSGFVLAQMKLSRRGDLFFPGSSDFMESAKREGLVFPDTERIVAYLIPAINVQKGNPRGIYSLRDLTRKGLRVAIANPEMVCVGTYAVEIIEKNFTVLEKEGFKKNLVNYTESCEKTATVISLRAVDAVIGWEVFQHWDPDRIETILLKPEAIARIGYIPVAVSKFTNDKGRAQRFIDFLLSPQGKEVFQNYHYIMDVQEARRFTRPDTPVGGEYPLPEEWKMEGRVDKRK